MLKNTNGTIITNIKFKNKSPNGLTSAAYGPNIKPAAPLQ